MPTQLTEYVVFAEVDGGWKQVANPSGPSDLFRDRDHKGAMDQAMALRPEQERKGGMAACPVRNWREFEYETTAEYRTTATERRRGAAAPEPEPEPEPEPAVA
jgi:hypothetical protein